MFNQEAYREAVINAFVHNSWIDGNAPMFTGFHDRLEILSRGKLPPKQTMEGFFAGESIPVNPALSRIFIQLHITEHTGRGVPKIIEAYSQENIRFNENSITVTIPYDRLGENVPVEPPNVPVNVPVKDQNVPVRTSNKSDIEERILVFCSEPKGIMEIAGLLGYGDKRTVRKYINPLLETGRLAMTVPDKPNSSKQKYITIK